MTGIDEIKEKLGEYWLPRVYREKVRPMRTRSFAMSIAEKQHAPDIQHTLLGIELKVGKLRIACPDLATARYLLVFARIGAREVAIPYDISRISALADDLETGWQRLLLLTVDITPRSRNAVVKAIREEIKGIGAGDAMPAFDTPTRQRTRK